jgi:putative PIN family toxin of toxin-antitoxin system
VKIVVDTNVIVSGVFFGGSPGAVLEAWRDGRVELVVSLEILDEYRRVGEEIERRFPDVSIAPFLTLVATCATVVKPDELVEPVTADPDDDKLFACALAAACRIIVSGDKHVLEASGYRGVNVMKPRALVDLLRSKP